MALEDRTLEKPQEKVKVNPFKELPRPKQPQVVKEVSKEQSKKEEQPRQKGEIVIKLNSRKMMRGLLTLVVLLAVFYAGRFTAGNSSLELPDFSSYFSHDAGPSGLVTGDAEEVKQPEAEVKPAEPAEEQNETEEPVGTEAVSETNAAVNISQEDNGPETFVTESYSKVALSLDEVYKDWKGSWGKIMGVKYTIKNNEAGTIRPHHFTMLVEGYDTGENKIEKEFEVGIESQRVKAGQTAQDEAAVGGFSYSPKSIPDGDLKKVRITLILYDDESKLMASYGRDVDLSGE